MQVGWSGVASSDIYVARNKTILPFVGKEYDRLLWIDSDQFWTIEDILQLYHDDRDIVSGLTPIDGMMTTQCGWIDEGGETLYITGKACDPVNPLVEVDFAGFGFLMFKPGVFESLEYPFFTFGQRETKSGVKFLSEDLAFSQKVKEKGFEIWADTRVRVGHQKTVMAMLPSFEEAGREWQNST